MTSVEPNKEETSYTLAEPTAVGGVVKQGHKCCGGCCDMRRAVIIVNIINACMVGFGMLGLLATKNLAQNADNIYDDDVTIAKMSEFADAPMGTALALMAAQIVASLCGIAGGMKFHAHLTAVAAVAYAAMLLFALIQLNIASIVYQGFFLYPHVLFIQEIRKGIMNEQNYPHEKQSCCCV